MVFDPLPFTFFRPGNPSLFTRDYLNRAGLNERGDCVAYEDIPDRVDLPGGVDVFTGINRLGPAAAEMFGELGDQIHLAIPVLRRPREADGGGPVLLHTEKEVGRALGTSGSQVRRPLPPSGSRDPGGSSPLTTCPSCQRKTVLGAIQSMFGAYRGSNAALRARGITWLVCNSGPGPYRTSHQSSRRAEDI